MQLTVIRQLWGEELDVGWLDPLPPSLGILYLLCSFLLNVCFVHFQNSRWIWLPPILIPLQYLRTRKHQGKHLEEGKFHWLVVNCTRFSSCTNFCFYFYMLFTFLLPCSDLCHAGQFLDMFKNGCWRSRLQLQLRWWWWWCICWRRAAHVQPYRWSVEKTSVGISHTAKLPGFLAFAFIIVILCWLYIFMEVYHRCLICKWCIFSLCA